MKSSHARDILQLASDYAVHDERYGKDTAKANSGCLLSMEVLGHCTGFPKLAQGVELIIRRYPEMEKNKEAYIEALRDFRVIINDSNLPFTAKEARKQEYFMGSNFDFPSRKAKRLVEHWEEKGILGAPIEKFLRYLLVNTLDHEFFKRGDKGFIDRVELGALPGKNEYAPFVKINRTALETIANKRPDTSHALA